MVFLKRFAFIAMTLITPAVFGADLSPASVQVDGLNATAQFDLSHLGQDCGIVVKWGDGTEQKIRVGRDVNEKDFTVSHSYATSDGYIFEVDGSTIKKGLGTVFGCQAATYRNGVMRG
jgi:hypothetical protein